MKRKTSKKVEDQLRVEGVGAKGFGVIPRYAMLDPDLSCWAKLLYAYLCSLAGSGSQTWPKRETILTQLDINKATYYKAQKELTEQGYISINQTRKGNRQGANRYTLVSCPHKVKLLAAAITDRETMTNRVIAHGLKAGGYGMLPRQVMQDERLYAKTKLVYAYLASYAGAGSNAFPSTPIAVAHLQLNQRMWQRAIRELSQNGYLEVTQRRIQGRFSVYDYCLLDTPKENGVKNSGVKESQKSAPEVKKRDTEKLAPEVKKRDTKKPAPEVKKQDTEKSPEVTLWDAQKRDTENNDTYLTNLSTVLSSNSIQSIYQQSETGSAQSDESEDRLIDYEEVKARLKAQLQLEREDKANEIYGSDLAAAQELLSLLADALSGSSDTFRLGKGQKPKTRLWELRPEHLRYVIESVREQHGQRRIYNLRSYYLAALYHAPETLSSYQTAQVIAAGKIAQQAERNRQDYVEAQRLLALMKEE